MTSLRTLFACFTLAAGPAVAQERGSDWTSMSPREVARAQPDTWRLLEDEDALQSVETGLVCPSQTSFGTLTTTRGTFVPECWYQMSSTTGIWIVGLLNVPETVSALDARRARMFSDSGITVVREPAGSFGECTFDIYRIHNTTGGFWIILIDLFAPDAILEFRRRTDSDALRPQLRENVQELLDLSLRSVCNLGVS
jgi:hypothetical protein